MTKICTICLREMPHTDFHKNSHHRDGLASQCKDCKAKKEKAERLVQRGIREAAKQAIDSSPTKRCHECHQDLPRTDFCKKTGNRDGLNTRCRTCDNRICEAYQLREKTTLLAKAKIYYVENRTQIRQRQNTPKLVADVDPDTTLKTCSQCAEAKPLSAFARHRANNDGRQTLCKDCQSENRRTNRLALNAYQRAWSKLHREGARLRAHRRRAREAGLPDTMTEEQTVFCYHYWHFSCAICGNEEGLFGVKLVLDHWIPLASPTSPGTVADNLVLLCNGPQACNTFKHAKDPVAWLTKRFGPRKAHAILKRVGTYFAIVRERFFAA